MGPECNWRVLRVLLPWAQPQAIEAIYRSLRVVDPPTPREFYELVERRRKAFEARGEVTITLAGGVVPIDTHMGRLLAADVLASDAYRDRYAFLGGEIARIPLDGLLTPQIHVDWSYVEELAASLPEPGDDEAAFRRCFGSDEVGDPLVVSAGGVQTASVRLHRNQQPWVGQLRAVRRGSGVTLSVDIEPRTQFVQVAVVPLTNGQTRVVIVNGVHRLLALRAAKHTHAYGFVKAMPAHELQGLFDPGPVLIADPAGKPLPARLEDFEDSTVYDVVRQTPVDMYLRMLVHADNVVTPSSEASVSAAELPMPVKGAMVPAVEPAVELNPG